MLAVVWSTETHVCEPPPSPSAPPWHNRFVTTQPRVITEVGSRLRVRHGRVAAKVADFQLYMRGPDKALAITFHTTVGQTKP